MYEDVVLLYNPTTRESKLLPAESTETVKRYREKFISYGFGFDHLTNDYKVVKLVADSNNLLYACVYSLKSRLVEMDPRFELPTHRPLLFQLLPSRSESQRCDPLGVHSSTRQSQAESDISI